MNSSFVLRKRLAGIVGAIIWLGISNAAHSVQFDLRDTTATVEIESGTITRSGITATLTPVVAGNTGVLNQTASNFGVNADNLNGAPHDDTDQLDGVDGAESVQITFNVDVLWLGLQLSDYSGNEQAGITISSFPTVALAPTADSADVYTFGANNLVLAGSSVILQWISGNGFSFDSFTVEKWTRPPTRVPDAGAPVWLLFVTVAVLAWFKGRTPRSAPGN